MAGWIGVDFDGTLCRDDMGTWPEPGEPVPVMLERVRRWLEQGQEVRIVTARASSSNGLRAFHVRTIKEWCVKHLGRELDVTAEKDFGMIELWDDRAVQVVKNDGTSLVEILSAYGLDSEEETRGR